MNFTEIFEHVENNEISFRSYSMYLEALELNRDHLQEALTIIKLNNDLLLEWDYATIVKNIKSITTQLTDPVKKAAWEQAGKIIEKIKTTFGATIDAFIYFGTEASLEFTEIVKSLKSFEIYNALKHSAALIGKSTLNIFNIYSTAYQELSKVVFGNIADMKPGEILKNNATAIQEFIERNPKIKYIVGPIIAYSLYYIWTQMTFKGDFVYDFDWSELLQELKGNVDVVKVFSGQDGVELLFWFMTGITGILPSAPWLDGVLAHAFKGLGNHALAVLLTFMIFMHKKHSETVKNNALLAALQKSICLRNSRLDYFHGNSKNLIAEYGKDRGILKPLNFKSCN